MFEATPRNALFGFPGGGRGGSPQVQEGHEGHYETARKMASEKIRLAVSNLSPYKAPGVDGV